MLLASPLGPIPGWIEKDLCGACGLWCSSTEILRKMVRERRLSEKERSGEKESEADGVME